MKQVKLYNVIFPLWFLMFFPPVISIALIGNFIIDSLVIIACFSSFKLASTQTNLKTFYKKTILKVWIFGFLADAVGAGILLILTAFQNKLGISNKLIEGLNFDPFSYPLALILILFAMLVSGALIFLLNYKFTLNKLLKEKPLRLKVALAIAVITIPWTFLLPTKWFYPGF